MASITTVPNKYTIYNQMLKPDIENTKIGGGGYFGWGGYFELRGVWGRGILSRKWSDFDGSSVFSLI